MQNNFKIIKNQKINLMKKIGSLFPILFSLNLWAGQVRFSAIVDKKEVSKDGELILSLVLTSDTNVNEEEPTLPNLTGFQLLGKRTESQASSVLQNGKFQFITKKIYHYSLSPQKIGKLTIGPAEIKVDGQALTSQPIPITVVAGEPKGSGVAKGQAGDDEADTDPFGDEDDLFTQLLRRRGLMPDDRGGVKTMPQNDREAFFITVETNKSKVFVGEQIVANFYLYTRGNIQGYDVLKYPQFHGFWREDLELSTRLNFQTEVVNGVPYQKALLVSYALFPIAAGKKIIDAYKAKATVISLNSGMGMFGIGRPFTYVKVSKELPIEVKPLPTEGRPASFSGAVGQFNITGSLSATQVKVNQPVSLKVRFQGIGNVKAIELPALNLPKNLEVYDTKKETQFSKSGESFKEFEVLLIPRSQGEMTIPPISVSYFDPQKVKYVSQSTPEFKINVLPGDGNIHFGSAPLDNSSSTQQSAQAAVKDIRYLKSTRQWGLSPQAGHILWPSLFLAIWAWLGVSIFRIKKGQIFDHRAQALAKAKAKLKVARGLLKKSDRRAIGVECSNAILTSLGEITGLGGASLTIEDMLKRWPQMSPDFSVRVTKFIEKCEVLSFAPNELQKQDVNLKSIVQEAEELIAEIFSPPKTLKS